MATRGKAPSPKCGDRSLIPETWKVERIYSPIHCPLISTDLSALPLTKLIKIKIIKTSVWQLFPAWVWTEYSLPSVSHPVVLNTNLISIWPENHCLTFKCTKMIFQCENSTLISEKKFMNLKFSGTGGGSAVKCACHSCRRPVFRSQDPHSGSQLLVTRDLMPSSCLFGHKTPRCFTDTDKFRHTHLHKINILITQIMNSLQIQQISLLICPIFTNAPACELVRCSCVSFSETPQTLKHSLEMIAL